MDELIELVRSVGFPIVAYLLMFLLVKDQLIKLTETIEKNTQVLGELRVCIRTIGNKEVREKRE